MSADIQGTMQRGIPTRAPGPRAPGLRVLLAVASLEGLRTAAPLARLLAEGDTGHLTFFHGVLPELTEAGLLVTRILEQIEEGRPSEEVKGLPRPDVCLMRDTADPAQAILEAARSDGADVIVMTPLQRSLPSRLLVGSVTEQVVRHSERPVLAVPLGCREARHPRLDRILVATGDEAPPSQTMALVHRLARRDGALVEVLHILPSRIPRQVPPEEGALTESRWEEASPSFTLRTRTVRGQPTEEILDRAHALHADLVILSRTETPAQHRAFLGSTIERCLRRSQTPVIVVPA